MDPNQFNTYYSLLSSNSDDPPQNQNPTNSPSPRASNPYTFQNNEFQVPYFPQAQFPFTNFPSPTGNMATHPFQSQIHTPSSDSGSIGVGGPSNPTFRGPLNLNMSSPYSYGSNNCEVDTSDSTPQEFDGSGKGKTHWGWEEDALLISAWLNVSTDVEIGNDQKCEAFWKRIEDYCRVSNPMLIRRGTIAIKKRWYKISEGASRFVGVYDQACRKSGSGTNDKDIMELAHNLFKTRYKMQFKFELHWNELRKHPKWMSLIKPRSDGSKRSKINTSGAYSSSSNPETLAEERAAERAGEDVGVTSPVRPKGKKLSQNKRRGKATTSNDNVLDEEVETFKANEKERLKYLREMKEIMEIDTSMKVLSADTSKMSGDQRATYDKILGKIKDKYDK